MVKNQNDNSNQNADKKSYQEKTQDGKKKEITNPNNPKASQNDLKGNKPISPKSETKNAVPGKNFEKAPFKKM